MSYTPTTWTTGDTITASAMNKIEQGIANAGGSIPLLLIYHNGVSWETSGIDFATALSMVQDGKPIMAWSMEYYATAGVFTAIPQSYHMVAYNEEYPNRIDIQITGGVGWYWTANGIEYYD